MEEAPELKELSKDYVENHFSTTISSGDFSTSLGVDYFSLPQNDYTVIKKEDSNLKISTREETLSDSLFCLGIERNASLLDEDEQSKEVISKLRTTPTESFKLLIKKFLSDLEFFNLKARRIASLDDDGICFMFNHNSESLYLEVYNDGEISSLIEDVDRKKILALDEFDSVNEAITSIKSFLSKGFSA